MTDIVIRAEGLVKDYGTVRALNGLDLEVRRGEVFGFVGPNGAGKSTTIRILLDLLRPTAGRVEVLGSSPRQKGAALRARIGYLPGELSMDGSDTAGDALRYLARLRGAGSERIVPLAERFGLDLERPIRGLSKGNKQKVGVVQAFMHQPEVLVLDEPTSGLDPLLQHEFLSLVDEAQAAGATVFMSSHVLSEVEAAADRVAIIRDGALIDIGDMAALRNQAGQHVRIRFADPVDAPELVGLPGVDNPVLDGTTFTCVLHGEPDRLIKAAAGHHVTAFRVVDRDLEDLFLDLYRPEVTS